jgi:DNA-binding NarL/FixJ family response regulator
MTGKNGGGKIRVLVVAASSARRTELVRLVSEDSSFKIAGSLSGFAGLNTSVMGLRPDVVLVDLADSDPQFLSTLAFLEAADVSTLALVDDPEKAWISQALRAGVRGILARNSAASEIQTALRVASQNLVLLDPDLARRVSADERVSTPENDYEQLDPLTAREIEVLRMMAEGFGNREIASRLGISDNTVKFHISSILGKLGASSRTEAVTLGIRKGLILL